MNIASKKLIEIVGVSAVILSLLFVGYELRLARSIAESEGFTEMSELTRSLHEFIAANADVWARGCVAEDLTSSEAVVFSNIVLSLIYNEFTKWGRARIGISNAPTTVGASSLAYNMYNFPGINAIWEKSRHKNSQEFQQAVNEEYEILEESLAERNYDVALCGN